MTRFKKNPNGGYSIKSDYFAWGLCEDGVKKFLGNVDYVCFAKKPPEYARDEAYKIRLHIGEYGHYYFAFLDTLTPRYVLISHPAYRFFNKKFSRYQPFYAWGEYAEE